jgi:hypothetical protein
MKPEDVVTVDVLSNPLEAEMVANSLRTGGVACIVEGSGQAGVTGDVEVRILVRAWDADRARKLIKAMPAVTAISSHSPKRAARGAHADRAANGVRRQRIAAKARRGVSPV